MNEQFIEIVNSAKSGNQEAFEALYNMTKDSTYFVAINIANNEHDALDILQDSYIKAFRKIDTVNPPELFDNWLNSIVANTAKDYLRKKKPLFFDDIKGTLPDDYVEEETNASYIPHQSIDNNETSRLIMDIINELPEDQRLCILMFYYEDMSVADIATSLDISVSNVKYRLYAARKVIKAKVEKLEKNGTKLYGAAPLAILPSLFANTSKISAVSHPAPAYASILEAATAFAATSTAASVSAATAAKAGFLSTVAGKIAVAIAAVVIVGGGITAAVSIASNSSGSSNQISSNSTNNAGDINIENMDLFSYTVELDGVVYTMPCDLNEFEKNGWHLTENSQKYYDQNGSLSAQDTTLYYEITKNEDKASYAKVYVAFANTSTSEMPVQECKIGSFRVDIDGSQGEEAPVIRFPGGLTVNRSLTANDIISKYGEPDKMINSSMFQYYNKSGGNPETFFVMKNEGSDPSSAKASYEFLCYDIYS